MTKSFVFRIAGAVLLVSVLTASADNQNVPECPKSIATIAKGILSPIVARTMKELYGELDCPVQFVALPGRRGIHYFNAKRVDGEVMRLEKAEATYYRKFVRSSTPLYSLTFSLWRHPNGGEKPGMPIGYTMGVIWQEDYMKNKTGRRFHDAAGLFEAYNEGKLSGFLAADISVRQLIDNGTLNVRPEKQKTVLAAPMFHYLGKEFAPFMEKMNALILARNPFAYVSEMQN